MNAECHLCWGLILVRNSLSGLYRALSSSVAVFQIDAYMTRSCVGV